MKTQLAFCAERATQPVGSGIRAFFNFEFRVRNEQNFTPSTASERHFYFSHSHSPSHLHSGNLWPIFCIPVTLIHLITAIARAIISNINSLARVKQSTQMCTAQNGSGKERAVLLMARASASLAIARAVS